MKEKLSINLQNIENFLKRNITAQNKEMFTSKKATEYSPPFVREVYEEVHGVSETITQLLPRL